jgi:4-alpha-glucanotransferase
MLPEKRCAGVFLHPSSLPSRFGVGDLGPDVLRWLDMLAENKQRLWQVCPIGPTGFGNSPYQTLSSFAGNPLLISPERLFEKGLLTCAEIDGFPRFPSGNVAFDAVGREKEKLFRAAFSRFRADDGFESFCSANRTWLDEYALFIAAKNKQGGLAWYEWDAPLRKRKADALAQLKRSEARSILYCKFLQFHFRVQWGEMRSYAASKPVSIIGDIPFYVAHDSCDAWASPHVFEFDADGNRRRMGGVPPDYFSADGQLWGNPVYDWAVMKKDGYAWWIRRIRETLALVDIVRIDHFRGFEAFWAVPSGAKNARTGAWVKGPGAEFFSLAKKQLGTLPLIAEDLGIITDRVRTLLRRIGLPGMKVLQFAFDDNPDNPYLPYNIPPESVVYTGTHDNDTSVGWFRSLDEGTRGRVRMYLGCSDEAFHDYFLRLAYSSPSRMCIIPLQDILALDSSHRFNTPGTGGGNWGWRFAWDMLHPGMFERAARYTTIYGRYGREADGEREPEA